MTIWGEYDHSLTNLGYTIQVYTNISHHSFYFDLYNAIPYHNMEPSDRPIYWNADGVHFTAAGYDLMGEKIAEELIRIMKLAEAQDTDIMSIASDPRQRRAIESMIFEEERGDPRLLSQGYIVVRKKDLD